MEKPGAEPKHFVLVHGICHGAWCWYKVITPLKVAGHQVTALDMAASGIDTRSIQDVPTMAEYSQPLLDFMEELPPDEKVVLVGHSLGGLNIALAMEKFPEKISVAVFLTAFMPDTVNPRSYVTRKFFTTEPPAIVHFGAESMKQKYYQNSPMADLELARMLTRPGSNYIQDLSRGEKFTEENYGSVKRVYVVCGEDLGLPKEFQHWMIENYGATTDVMYIPNADHAAMTSTPEEVVKCLLEAAGKYA